MLRTPSKAKKKASRRAPRKTPQALRCVVLGTRKRDWVELLSDQNSLLCRSEKHLRNAIGRSNEQTLWVSTTAAQTESLACAIAELIDTRLQYPQRLGDLVTLEPAKASLLATLGALFGRVVGVSREFKKLPIEQLDEFLRSPLNDRRDVFIGGTINASLGTLVLVRGNLETIIVPLSIFRPSGAATPDFKKFALGDYGQTVRFGDYEATADVILYQFDPDYRKRAKAKERATATGFGPALRRLRLLKGLKQNDFQGVTRETISRIENSRGGKPHADTLRCIAAILGVPADQIETY